ncbi:hypothetical protein G9464_03345 [Halostella sp. JP-L12]|uniref:hypothetical protein n=1 Tax=Halostella TaxID=1843185 RepID=UPI000EF7DF62|nr:MULTISPECIES: hypothetical protein [Halostella]NHN46631.1 hypothetical protein [Halostella sp. JP-L12]
MTRDRSGVSRRAVLRASSGAVGFSALAPQVGPGADGRNATDRNVPGRDDRCPDATKAPSMRHCEAAETEGCADDHPETAAIREDVDDALTNDYPDVGTLIDEGFVPYFDLARDGDEGGYSHWLNPEFIGDDSVLDPERPESVLVDNKWWRPIGVMFVGTEGGDPLDSPPAVYETEDGRACAPWHYHAGRPGRFAWWYYEQFHEAKFGEWSLQLPCRTPCMLHVWTYPNPEGVYAHGPPPRGNRGGPPAEDPGFDTPATPGEDDLSWAALPDDFVSQVRPAEWIVDLLEG